LEFYYQKDSSLEEGGCNDTTSNSKVEIVCRLHGPLAKLLKAYKYQHAKNLGVFLANVIFQHAHLTPHHDFLTYIPLHPLKLRQRGFNQCQVITQALGELWQIPVVDLLKRTTHLSPQAQITDHQERKNRVKGIFALDEQMKNLARGKRILLLDDVWTTGATWREAQNVLLTAGAASVDGLILASKK
jgi:ComF family protein